MRRVNPASEIPRCPVCGVHPHLCFCAGFSSFATRTRFVFLQHSQEALKPTNSARLACHILSSASIATWSRTAPPPFPPETILLYPSAEAIPLAAEELTESALIVIPDGTWSQASRIASVLGKRPIVRRTLPLGNSSVRQSDDPERISSAQAAAMVLHLAGETIPATSLFEAVAESGRRILSMRGMKRETGQHGESG
jgi:DTW domain-containing protein YfiP